jgi:16S rRNA (adenine1518-N6/adenine1519-N6)-dimethyltransferase
MRVKKFLGQHFLKNKKILKFLANSLGDIKNKIVVEIGGGHGELTQFLYKKCKLFVYEIDKELVEILKEKFPDAEIINEDFLKAGLEKFKHNYYLIGNIPYYLTGKILRKIFDIKNYPKVAVLTLQKEYGKKILGLPHKNFLSIWVSIWCKPEKLFIIKRKCFYPEPKVDSIALKFIFYKKPKIDHPGNFEKFLKILFKNPKRTIYNNLKGKIKDLEIDKNLRPHQLSFEDILKLYKKYEKGN